MQAYLKSYLPDVICDIVMSYHLFIEMKSMCGNHNFLQVIPHNEKWFYAITIDALYQCCTQTLTYFKVFVCPKLIYMIRIDSNRLGLLSENGIFILHTSTGHFTHFRHKCSYVSDEEITVFQDSIYFCNGCRLYQYHIKEHDLKWKDYESHLQSVRYFQSTLIVQTMDAIHYIGPNLDAIIGDVEPSEMTLLPYDNGIIVHKFDGRNYIFGKWEKGGPIRAFLRLPDHEYIAVHAFYLNFYVNQKFVYQAHTGDQLIHDCFVANEKIFCLTYNRLLIIG